MGFELTGIGAAALATAALDWALASIVYFSGPKEPPNRRLAIVLLIQGAAEAGLGISYLVDDVRMAYAGWSIVVFAGLALPAAYLLFLSCLPSPLVRPLKPRIVQWLLVAAAVGAPWLWFLFENAFVLRMYRPWYAPWVAEVGPPYWAGLLVVVLISLYGLAVAISIFRAADTPGQRTKALSFMLAFGARDVLLLVAALLFSLVSPLPLPVKELGGSLTPVVLELFFAPLAAYGVLKHQMLALDLHVSTAVRRSTVLGAFGVTLFFFEQLLQRLVPSPGFLAALMAAGIIAAGLRPLNRLGQRIANLFFPETVDRSGYLHLEALRSYETMLADRLSDGVLGAKDRSTLREQRKRLNLSTREAKDVERKLRKYLGVPAARSTAESA